MAARKVSWKQSSAASRPTAATRKRNTQSRWSSRNRWNGCGFTGTQRAGRRKRGMARRPCQPALQRWLVGGGAAVDRQPRHLARGRLGVAGVEAGLAGQRAELVRDDEITGDDDQPALAPGRDERGRRLVVGPVGAVGVGVPAASGLAAEAPGGDHPRAERRGPPARLAEAELVER